MSGDDRVSSRLFLQNDPSAGRCPAEGKHPGRDLFLRNDFRKIGPADLRQAAAGRVADRVIEQLVAAQPPAPLNRGERGSLYGSLISTRLPIRLPQPILAANLASRSKRIDRLTPHVQRSDSSVGRAALPPDCAIRGPPVTRGAGAIQSENLSFRAPHNALA